MTEHDIVWHSMNQVNSHCTGCSCRDIADRQFVLLQHLSPQERGQEASWSHSNEANNNEQRTIDLVQFRQCRCMNDSCGQSCLVTRPHQTCPDHIFKGLRLTAGRRPSNDVWLMVWEDGAEILRTNPGRAMLNWGRHDALCLPVWKQSGPMLSAGCAHVGPSRGHVESSWAHLGFMFGQVGPSWAYIGPGWAYVGLCMTIFPPWAPSWSPKPRKNRCFLTSARWNSLLPKGPKHRKKQCLLTPQAKYTVNYRDFSPSGVVQG